MSLELFMPRSLEEACVLLAEKTDARPLAGGTDLVSRLERGIPLPPALVRLDGLGLDGFGAQPSGGLRVGPFTTHAVLANSQQLASWAPALAEASAAVGSPQVRNLGTLGGNLCNASPAADTAPALLALGAILEISGPSGKRLLPVDEFFLDTGRTALKDGEILSGIILPSSAPRSTYLKLGRRRALEIAVVGVAVALEMDGMLVKRCRIGMAAVAPTPMRARMAEAVMTGQELTAQVVDEAAKAAAAESRPITDHRASADYRREMVGVFFRRAVWAAAARHGTNAGVPVHASTRGVEEGKEAPALWKDGAVSVSRLLRHALRVNGEIYNVEIAPDRLLVDVLREDLGLTGTKKGCGEGECGCCTVLLDGRPVSSCLVLAATAGGKEISTVEGLARGDQLHPLQSALIREGAVQCGYCTPGVLMSANALLERNPFAGEREVKEALSGNLCRCTGYKKIIEGVLAAKAELSTRIT